MWENIKTQILNAVSWVFEKLQAETMSDLDDIVADGANLDKKFVGAKAVKELNDKIGEGGGGTLDYEKLKNLPEINGVELKGELTLTDLGIAWVGTEEELESDIDKIPNNCLIYTTNSKLPNGLEGRVNKISEDLQEVNNNLDWKLVDSVIGSNYINIPTNAKEILVETFNSQGSDTFIGIYPTITLSENLKYVIHGSYYYSNTEKAFCNLNAYKDRIGIRGYLYKDVNAINTAKMTLYYR